MDSFTIKILADGTIKMETSKVGAANHANAEQFFQTVARLAGGETKREHASGHAHHQHSHSHGEGEHAHQH